MSFHFIFEPSRRRRFRLLLMMTVAIIEEFLRFSASFGFAAFAAVSPARLIPPSLDAL
jgi:hypothetical protein